MKFDVIIIGGGPIGLACAIEAKKNQLSALVLEKGALTNSIYNYPLYMTFFSTAEKLTINDIPFTNISPKPGRQEALEYYRSIASYYDVNIHLYEEVKTIDRPENFIVTTTKGSYQAKNVIIATGFYDRPHLLNVPGEDLPLVTHYYKEAHPYAMQKVVVIGANNSAVDAALECYRKGADVTMLIRGSEFTSSLKYWVKPDIENRIKEGSIKAYFNTKIKEIKDHSIVFEHKGISEEVITDHVLAMTGYEPNFEFLTQAGITLQEDAYRTPIYNPETMETNVDGLYLAGVVCGGLKTNVWFIENSRIHATQIIHHIQNK